MGRRTLIALGVALALGAPRTGAAPAAPSAEPESGPPAGATRPKLDPARELGSHSASRRDPALEKVLALDVRSAPLADVVEEMAVASGVRMRLGRSTAPLASTGAADQRITLYAERASVGEFQRAVATLLRLKWRRDDRRPTTDDRRPTTTEGEAASQVVISDRQSAIRNPQSAITYTLEEETQTRAAATALRERQALHFLNGVWQTAGAMLTPATAAEHARKRRADFGQEHPEFGTRTLEGVDVPFLRQSLLIAPLDADWRGRLARQRWVSLPIGWLSDVQAALMVAFVYGDGSRPNGERIVGFGREPMGLAQPGARVQYRLFYGDRWSDTLLKIQVGTPGDWVTATLPSILYREEDGSALYPQSREKPTDAAVWRRLPPTFSVAGKGWDDALARLARTMKIRVASDSYRRPPLYQPEIAPPSVAGLPLAEAFDRLCRAHGMFWWKEGDWYYFRSRTWVEEENVAVPDRFVRRWADSARQNGRLLADDLDLLGGLSEEQLMTLNLLASARVAASGSGRVAPSPSSVTSAVGAEALDPDSAWLASASLIFFRSLAPVQREMALQGGLPAVWLAPIQQQIFGAIAAELGYFPQPETLSTWGFAIDQRFKRPTKEDDPIHGAVSFQWGLGPGVRRVAEVPIAEARYRRTGAGSASGF